MPGTLSGQLTASTLRLDACENVVAHLCREPKGGAEHTLDLVAGRSDGSTVPIECSRWCASDPAMPGRPVSQCAP